MANRLKQIAFVLFLIGLVAAAAALTRNNAGLPIERMLAATVQVQGESGTCSGVVVLASGLVLSNAHCTGANEKTVEVVFRDGKKMRALVLLRDEPADVLVLVVRARDLEAVTLRCDLAIEAGAEVYAVGHPTGLPWTVTRGIVSFVGRGDGGRWLQIDALLWFGNSGGPLFDARGRLVGLNNKIKSYALPWGGGQMTSHGFALTLPHICASLKAGGVNPT